MKKKDQGFTLIELLIALALSMVGLLGLLALQTSAIRGNGLSRNLAEATALAQDKIEDLGATPFTSLAAKAGTENNVASAYYPSMSYSRVTQINVIGTTATIIVTMTWTEELASTTKTHSVQMTMVRSQ